MMQKNIGTTDEESIPKQFLNIGPRIDLSQYININKKEFIFFLIAIGYSFRNYSNLMHYSESFDDSLTPFNFRIMSYTFNIYIILSSAAQYLQNQLIELPRNDLIELSQDDLKRIVIYLAKKHGFINGVTSILCNITSYFVPEIIAELLNSVKNLPYRINSNELNKFYESILNQSKKIRDNQTANFLSELQRDIRIRIDVLEKNAETTRLQHIIRYIQELKGKSIDIISKNFVFKNISLAFKFTFENSTPYTISANTLKSLNELSHDYFAHFFNHPAAISLTAAASYALTFSLLFNAWNDYAALLIIKAILMPYEKIITAKIPYVQHALTLVGFLTLSIIDNWNGIAPCLVNFFLTNISYELIEKILEQVELKLSENKNIQKFKSQYPYTTSALASLSHTTAHYLTNIIAYKAVEFTKFNKNQEPRQQHNQYENYNHPQKFKQHAKHNKHDAPTSKVNTVTLSDSEERILDSRYCQKASEFCRKTITKIVGLDPSNPNFKSKLRKLSLFWRIQTHVR